MSPLVVHADVGAKVGLGHVMRCLAIGQEWRARGGEVTFAITEPSEAVARRVGEDGCGCEVAASVDALRRLLVTKKPNWVVLDGYQFGTNEQRAIVAEGARALVIDDNGEMGRYECALILNHNVFAHAGFYRDRSDAAALLLGPSYALLRREFTSVIPRERGASATRVLFTFGGADPAGLSELAVAAWPGMADLGLEGLLLVGGANPRRAELEAAAGRVGLRVLYDAPSVPDLMQWADLALAAAGGTCFELAYLGVPSVIVVTADNQRAVADSLVGKGAARSLAERPSAAELGAAVRALAADASARRDLSARARALVDGRGPSRVVDAMMEVSA